MQQTAFFRQYKETINEEFAAILRECEHYAHADHHENLATLREEIKTASPGAFVLFFDNIEEDENGATGLDGDFFASLGVAAHSAALPRLKAILIDAIQQQYSFQGGNNMLDSYRISQIRIALNWGWFTNVTQAGKYCLQRFRRAGDGRAERRAILREVWEYHTRIVSGEIPFTFFVCGFCLWLLTGCTPLK